MSTPVQTLVESGHRTPASSDALLTNVAGGAIVILIIAACLLLLIRRFKGVTLGNRLAADLSVVASHSLGQRERLVVVDMQDKRMLIGVTSGQISCLGTFDRPDNGGPTAPVVGGGDFYSALSKLLKKGGAN